MVYRVLYFTRYWCVLHVEIQFYSFYSGSNTSFQNNHGYARARTGHECVGERKVPLRFKKVTWQSDSLIDSLAILGMKTETMKSLVLCENSWSQLNFSDSNYLWWFFTLSEDINKRTCANHGDNGNENVAKQKFNKQINSWARAL